MDYYRAPMPSTAPLWCLIVTVLAVTFGAGMVAEASIQYARQETKRLAAKHELTPTRGPVPVYDAYPMCGTQALREYVHACASRARMERVGL